MRMEVGKFIKIDEIKKLVEAIALHKYGTLSVESVYQTVMVDFLTLKE